MQNITQADLVNFAGLVAKIWNDPKLAADYQKDPIKVLSANGINLPPGVPTPVIPERPEGDIGKALQGVSFDNWDVTVTPLNPTGAGIAISSLGCFACPVSCFSSLSN